MPYNDNPDVAYVHGLFISTETILKFIEKHLEHKQIHNDEIVKNDMKILVGIIDMIKAKSEQSE